MKKFSLRVMFLSLLIFASVTVTSAAFDIPHNGDFATRYSTVSGKDDYYKRQASDAKFNGSKNGLTMIYVKDYATNTQKSASVYYEKREGHAETNYAVAQSHQHTATDNDI